MKKRHQQKLVFLGILLFFMWNMPFVSLFDGSFQILGFPAFYFFIFLSWLFAIIVAFAILRKFYE